MLAVDVTLALTVHQPTERLAGQVKALLPALAARYAVLVAYCSRETHAGILDHLRRHSLRVYLDDGESQGIQRIGEVRRRTIRAGLEAGTAHIQMCDFDRALHWVARFPDELSDVIAQVSRHDLFVLGRTPRAWATHPPTQADTEPLFNHVFFLATGLEWDVGAGSRGLSRRAAETLLVASREVTVGVDAEWPLLLLGQNHRGGDWDLGYRACEGLEFETADRFGPEIEAAGGYDAWVAEMAADPKRWAFRLQVANLIAAAVVRYGLGG